MVDQMWYRLVPLVVDEPDFHEGVQAGNRHWWDDWQGEGTPEEIAAFLVEDWSYARIMQRNEEARQFGFPVLSEGYATGFVVGWFGAMYGD